ncbi:hypothetical protein GF373_00325 [bacterium]|nr:hypothetical protein [bacterium]
MRRVEKKGRQVLMTSWSNRDENGVYLSIQAMLEEKTLLPIYSLLAYRLPHQSATSYFLCKFDEYAQFHDALFPKKWTITKYCQLSSQEDHLFEQNNNTNKAEWMIGPGMEFELQQVDMIQTLPFMKQHIYDFTPLDPAQF